MANIIDKSGKRVGATFETGQRMVVVYDGHRGKVGTKGDEGDPGGKGDSISVLGRWAAGETYCPLDAVSWRSSLVDHVSSLYVQKSGSPCDPSVTPPNEDPTRWEEIGATDIDNAMGGIWYVYQQNHGFTKVGQPIGYSFQSDSYVLASSRTLDELAIAVVREVVDADRVILQSSGEVPQIDQDIIYPAGSTWEAGQVYYVSSVRGRVELSVPVDPDYYTNPILIATDVNPSGGRNGVALPWTPSGGAGSRSYSVLTYRKFFFDAGSGQTVFSGPDKYGNDLSYEVGFCDVFSQGLNLEDFVAFTATDGTSITLTTAPTVGSVVEVWTPSAPPDQIVIPSTLVKLDNIETLFDDVQTTFPLSVGSIDLAFQATLNVIPYLDATPQEPLADYFVVERPSDPTLASLQFAEPIPAGTRFWEWH